MNANERRLKLAAAWAAGLALALAAGSASAEAGLGASSQTKVNNAKAKAWSQSAAMNRGDAYNDPVQQKRVVNMGSRRGNSCNVNVGTAQPGQKAPKEIVVTTKEVINVCK